jgi:hypothetical protein
VATAGDTVEFLWGGGWCRWWVDISITTAIDLTKDVIEDYEVCVEACCYG